MRRVLRVLLIPIVALVGAITFLLGTAQSHRTNARYLLWKAGMLQYQPHQTLRLFRVDPEFHESLIGRDLDYIQALFPTLVDHSNGNEYQRGYDWWVENRSVRWIEDSMWAFVFENGKVVEVKLVKG